MSDKKIKVSGYAKKELYNGNIEYRNFSPDLVGLQLTSEGGTPLFTMGNFSITTNLDPKLSKTYITNSFSDFITLSNINLDVAQAESLLNNNAGVYLNLDKTNLNYYAKFGSMTEYVRVALEKIIMSWPAALYLTPIYLDSNFIQSQGNTYQNYSYNSILDEATFKVNVNFIKNIYNINYLTSGTLENTFNETNDLRNLTVNYGAYCIYLNNVEYDVIRFTGSTDTVNDYIYFVVKGDPFSGIPQTVTYHIKPKNIYEELFYNGLDEFEYYLLNRMTYPKYTSIFSFPIRTDSGVLLYTSKSYTWPTTDGYNLDFDTDNYVTYVSGLLDLANTNDLTRSNLMSRFLVTEAITGFDTLPYYLDDRHEDTTGGKVTKLLNVYGRSFDDVNKFIDGVSFANTVTYNKLDNMPDKYLKDLARVLGWELISSINDNDLLSNYVRSGESGYSGQTAGLTPVEADVEMWRRIILNSPWLWKSKGARKSVEFLLRFIGTPNGLVKFNEYIYRADEPIDVDLFQKVLQLNGLDIDISIYPIDSDGYPKFFSDTEDMYFQNQGLWYRETGGVNSVIDILTGNNPHVGPYDGGYKYINQLNCLIPNFSAVTITSETITTTSYDLFTNYNSGEITNYSGDTYVDVTTVEGTDLPSCYVVNTTIELDPIPKTIISPCGCPTDEIDSMLSICLEKKEGIPPPVCPAWEKAPELNESGYYIFSLYQYNPDGSIYINNNMLTPIIDKTPFVGAECCETIGGVPMYTEFGVIDGSVNDLVESESGYICCGPNRPRCGCMASCNWIIKDVPKEYPTVGSGQYYLDFTTLYGLGASTLVTADGTNCPEGWTTPIQITDPYTGLQGFGCKIVDNTILASYSYLVAVYQYRAYYNEAEGTCCDFSIETYLKYAEAVGLTTP
jgi:hypothetical protein